MPGPSLLQRAAAGTGWYVQRPPFQSVSHVHVCQSQTLVSGHHPCITIDFKLPFAFQMQAVLTQSGWPQLLHSYAVAHERMRAQYTP